jgi:hypothetical protein
MLNLKRLINQFVECGEELVRWEAEYKVKISHEVMLRYTDVFKGLVLKRIEQNKIN